MTPRGSLRVFFALWLMVGLCGWWNSRVEAQPPVPKEGVEHIQGRDGAEMVLVPAGEFWMGSPEGEGEKNEHPRHRVYVKGFYIDKHEVTNARYRRCVEAGGCSPPHAPQPYDDPQRTEHPVVNIDWEQARAYCSWAGKRLPNEAEWEKAARGTDGRAYPWGNVFESGHANIQGSEDGYSETAPVGRFLSGASPCGALDMAGNVWEWVADRYDESYYTRSPSRNPPGPDNGDLRVFRGGSWNDYRLGARTAFRTGYVPGGWLDDTGFRCAQDLR